MGKMLTFIVILIFIDLMFLMTGQLEIDSPGSVIINAVNNPESLATSNFWIVLITGIAGLVVTAVVVIGLVTRNSDMLLFAGMAGTLALLIGDYIAIFLYLKNINPVLATIVMAPLMIIYVFVVVEWLRGKD